MDKYLDVCMAMWTPGPIELIVIGLVALLIFGKRLPEVARGLGRSLTEFKRGFKETSITKADRETTEAHNDISEESGPSSRESIT